MEHTGCDIATIENVRLLIPIPIKYSALPTTTGSGTGNVYMDTCTSIIHAGTPTHSISSMHSCFDTQIVHREWVLYFLLLS
jgi:hypothetical protein